MASNRPLWALVLVLAASPALAVMECKKKTEVAFTSGYCRGITAYPDLCVDSTAPTAMPNAFKAMVEAYPLVVGCDSTRTTTDPAIQREIDACQALQGYTNPCFLVYHTLCLAVGGTLRDDACSRQRFCDAPILPGSAMCVKDDDCAGFALTAAWNPMNTANGGPQAKPCCDTFKSNIDYICEGVTDTDSIMFTPTGGVCADSNCFLFGGASSLTASALMASVAALVATLVMAVGIDATRKPCPIGLGMAWFGSVGGGGGWE
eukprot:CAMPEP_0173440150 /NCGR_PEP_ID=MMETSP1357-20121228/22305_1 /TAXON_ID=77926 /ORGANISM="Hemiselmis rufescens, Strain PCC563" /LENGTH=261 /DNA_ID=CAMNT_0014405607 /DNA_START=22 /DNA_END=803 /DNA_ORIENTATION=-